jgi:hypothetical protein
VHGVRPRDRCVAWRSGLQRRIDQRVDLSVSDDARSSRSRLIRHLVAAVFDKPVAPLGNRPRSSSSRPANSTFVPPSAAANIILARNARPSALVRRRVHLPTPRVGIGQHNLGRVPGRASPAITRAGGLMTHDISCARVSGNARLSSSIGTPQSNRRIFQALPSSLSRRLFGRISGQFCSM